jgi:PQQ-like domain
LSERKSIPLKIVSFWIFSPQIKNRERKKMTNSKKIATITIAIFLVLSMAIPLTTIVSAHNPPITIPNYVYLNAYPSPVGQGQPISLLAWTNILPPTAVGQYGDRWTGLTVTVMKPDGSNDTLGPYKSDPVGTIFESYTPEAVGNYSFQFHMPAYKIVNANPDPNTASSYNNSPYINDTLSAADSSIVTVQVTSEPIAAAPSYPLPTEYWSNPVSQSGHSNTWVHITGDWLSNGAVNVNNINDYTQPPQTAHIAWTKPINIGGIAGLPSAIDSGGDNYYTYLSYETMFNPVILMNGVLYYNIANPPEYGFKAVDLRTGDQLWYQNTTQDPLAVRQPYGGFAKQNYPQLSFGQELNYISPNQEGALSYLWSVYTMSNGSNVWAMYDPFSGNWIMDIVGVPATGIQMVPSQSGDYIIYTYNPTLNTLSVFNVTQCIQADAASLSQANGYWMWRPQLGGLLPASLGTTVYNVTGTLPPGYNRDSLQYVDADNQLLIYTNVTYGLSAGTMVYPSPTAYNMFAISINPATIGQVAWKQVYPWPSGNLTIGYCSNALGNDVFALFQKETRLWMGFSTTTGSLLWTSTTPEIDNHMYDVSSSGAVTSATIYHGVLYNLDRLGAGGNVYAYDATTGALLFNYASPPMDNTGYWATIPTLLGSIGAGNLYYFGSEHSPGPVLEPGMKLGDLNASTGEPIWNITFWSSGSQGAAIADGYLVALNGYDNQIYSFGKGPSSTSIETPLNGITQGQSFTIKGTVIDISAGAKQSAITARFPHGLPAVSDVDQTAWMEYVYMQNPKPTVSGVPVSIDAIDPNGNNINLGTTHSDSSGLYSFQVNPNMLTAGIGTYTIIASFTGSNSYWPSYSESPVTLNPTSTVAPTAIPQTNLVTTSDLITYLAIGVIAIIIAIALVGLLLLRKKP